MVIGFGHCVQKRWKKRETGSGGGGSGEVDDGV